MSVLDRSYFKRGSMFTLRNALYVSVLVAIVAVLVALSRSKLKLRDMSLARVKQSVRTYFMKATYPQTTQVATNSPNNPIHEEFYKPRPPVARVVDPPLTNRNLHADRDDREDHAGALRPHQPVASLFGRAPTGSGADVPTHKHPLTMTLK